MQKEQRRYEKERSEGWEEGEERGGRDDQRLVRDQAAKMNVWRGSSKDSEREKGVVRD